MTYEYSCTNCNKSWEADQSITDERIKECPFCKEETAKRLISSSGGFILNGSCWGKDNYSK